MGKTGPGFFAHQGGMLELLQISGPEVYQSHDLLQSFAGLRGIAVSFFGIHTVRMPY